MDFPKELSTWRKWERTQVCLLNSCLSAHDSKSKFWGKVGHDFPLARGLKWDFLTPIRTCVQISGSYCPVAVGRELACTAVGYRNLPLWALCLTCMWRQHKAEGTNRIHVRPVSASSLRFTKQGPSLHLYHSQWGLLVTVPYQMAQNWLTLLTPPSWLYICVEWKEWKLDKGINLLPFQNRLNSNICRVTNV